MSDDFWSMADLADVGKGSASEIGKFMEIMTPQATSVATAALLAARPAK